MTIISRTPSDISLKTPTVDAKLFSNTLNTTTPADSSAQKLAFAPAIGWYAMNAVWINPLVYAACAGLGAWAVYNIFKILKGEPQESLTATQKEQLNNALGTVAQDKRFDTAPAEIKQRLNIDTNATNGTVFHADTGKKGSSSNSKPKGSSNTPKKGGGKKPEDKDKLKRNIATLQSRARRLKEIMTKAYNRMEEIRLENETPLKPKERAEYEKLAKEYNDAKENNFKVDLKLLELRGRLLNPN